MHVLQWSSIGGDWQSGHPCRQGAAAAGSTFSAARWPYAKRPATSISTDFTPACSPERAATAGVSERGTSQRRAPQQVCQVFHNGGGSADPHVRREWGGTTSAAAHSNAECCLEAAQHPAAHRACGWWWPPCSPVPPPSAGTCVPASPPSPWPPRRRRLTAGESSKV